MDRKFIIYPGPHKGDTAWIFPVVEMWEDGTQNQFMDSNGDLKELIRELRELIDSAKSSGSVGEA